MPLLRKQPFEKSKAPENIKPEDEVFYCEATGEVFTDYEQFFERTILCNSLVWSCGVTGKSNMTYDEACDSEAKAKKRISNLPKPLKKGVLWLTHHKIKKGRLGDLVDDISDWIRNRYFVGEIVDAVIGNQWCESTVLKVIAPTEEEVKADMEQEQEVTEVEKDGSPKKDEGNKEAASGSSLEERLKNPPDHLYKYEVEETCPDDEDVVEHHIIEADDVRRDKGIVNRDKLSLYLKNVVELNEQGLQFKLKAKGVKIYNLDNIAWSEIYAGPEPLFEETLRKVALMTNKKKGQFTLDGWATKGDKKAVNTTKEEKEKKTKEPKESKKPKKQTPEEIEAEMRKLREAQAKYREELRLREEEAKKKRIEDKQKEKERKVEEKKLVKEIMQEWNSRREDLDCEDHKELPLPTPIRSRVPNHLLGDFLSVLEFLNSFSAILELKDTYPHGVTFSELESALVETEAVDGSFYDIISFMLVSLFDLQLEEEEEAKAFDDSTAHDELHEGLTGKDENVANAIRAATETQFYTKKNLGLTLREVHLDQWSITEVLRLHFEASGAFRGNNLQNWRYNQRGGWKLSDDPGFQFCQENPQILASLKEKSVFEVGVTEKVKILAAMMNQMLTFAGVRDELDNRMENIFETRQEVKATRAEEVKRLAELDKERIKKKKEEREKEKEKKLIEDENKDKKEVDGQGIPLTTRQQEKEIMAKEREEQDKKHQKDKMREEFLERESQLTAALSEYQRSVSIQCLGRDRAFRRFWVFDSVPGVFVEHDDDLIGCCRDGPTPWNPDLSVTPLTEEQAVMKAREMMEAKGVAITSSPSSDKENKNKASTNGTIPIGEVGKTYSKKNPVMKQNVLGANNGSLSVQKTEVKTNGLVNGEVKEEETEEAAETKLEVPTCPWGLCLGQDRVDECAVHSKVMPRVTWAYYSSVNQIDQLLDSLNTRGVREGELRDKITAERAVIERGLKKCRSDQYVTSEEDKEELGRRQLQEVMGRRNKQSKHSDTEPIPLGTSLKELIELSLRDQILELEEKIHFGNLGLLKVSSREDWVAAISNKSYTMGADSLAWGEGDKLEAGADLEDNLVQQMAAAVLQLGQMVTDHDKYLKRPLGEDEKEKKKRLKREEDAMKRKEKEKEEAEGNDDDGEEEEVEVEMTPFKIWEKSLMSSNTLGQIFIHLTTFDNSIVWSKSIMNTKCKVCRKKADPELMLLCDRCDNAYHMYCLKPKLKSIPEGDWFCPECKPKERVRSPKKKVRKSFSFHEAESDEEEEEEVTSRKKTNNKSKKRIIESDEEEKKETPPKKKGGRKKIVESDSEEEEEEELRGNSKKGGLVNLLGKRGAAKKAEKQMKGLDNSYRDEDNFEDEEQTEKRSRRSRASNKTEDKENTRKRGRNLNESVELDVSSIEDILKAMLKHKDGWPFDRPITKAEAPDYHLHIKTPIDLATIKSRLSDMFYSKNQEVIDDIRLVFSNCYSYNMEDAEEYGCAERLEKYFDNQLKSRGLSGVENARSKKRRF